MTGQARDEPIPKKPCCKYCYKVLPCNALFTLSEVPFTSIDFKLQDSELYQMHDPVLIYGNGLLGYFTSLRFR